jgi:hypothetical protein
MWKVFLGCAMAVLTPVCPLSAAEPEAERLAKQFEPTIRPLVARYCTECHNREVAEAELDLSSIDTWAKVRQSAEAWQKVAEMLDSGQMPPKDSRQPTAPEREQLSTWVRSFLKMEAQARAGDPGRVVLRRLSNAEYTYTIRDLTGLGALEPARDFPVDGAAGEGFTNTGNALVMSPALVTKYLDAGKDIANHAVLLPDGFRFSPHTTRQDWVNETLDRIRTFYDRYSDSTPGEAVNLQGLVFNTNGGGRLPLEKYLAATIEERDALAASSQNLVEVAQARRLNPKYLATLHAALVGKEPSLPLDSLRAKWRAARPDDEAALVADVSAWQKELWRFTTVGHIGKVGGPQRWMETVEPLAARQSLNLKLAPTDSDTTTVTLIVADAGDGAQNDHVLLDRPRLVAPGRPEILLRDLPRVASQLAERRKAVLSKTSQYLLAADKASQARGEIDVADVARKHAIDADALAAWLDYLGVGWGQSVQLSGHFTDRLTKPGEYEFIQGWGDTNTPVILANSSDTHVRVPGNMKPHSVAVHPSPTHLAAVGWQSPLTTDVRVEGEVTHAHPECGNGVTWSLEVRRGATRRRLADGISHGAQPVKVGPLEKLEVRKGDVLSLLIGPRDGNHSCDLTSVQLKVADLSDEKRQWDLAGDVSPDVLAANPHDDRLGNKQVWHFYAEAEKGASTQPAVPEGSVLARWQQAKDADRQKLAGEVESLLMGPAPATKDSPDATLHRQLATLSSPLFRTERTGAAPETKSTETSPTNWGVDGAKFGEHPGKRAIDDASLVVQAPTAIQIRLPTELVAGYELITTASIHESSSGEGSVQVQLVQGTQSVDKSGPIAGLPILAAENSPARRRIASGLHEFRQLFPPALCYTKIVPVDEVVTLTLYYREDDHLMRLMLSADEQAELDRLWNELHYISQDAFTRVDALAQIIEFATQDSDPTVFIPLRGPFQKRADDFRRLLVETEPFHLQTLRDFTAWAYRRPLRESDQQELDRLYRQLRDEGIAHEEAIRLLLARVLVSPAFLYRIEQPVPGDKQGPVSDGELATRLSYFLWSSLPDDELRAIAAAPDAAAAERLSESDMLRKQTQRMLRDPKIRRLATEFACQWLQIYALDELDEKSERQFPEFAELRGPMYEESILFFTDLFQRNGSILEVLDADYTFLNERLAAHYGIENVKGEQWRRVDGMKQFDRGGILAQASMLSKQSGASRTSPILRGIWISEFLLGQRLPRPPAGVPPLPDEDASTLELTVRELTERHSSDPKCAVCHADIDPLGFSLEGFDAIGRRRDKDSADRSLDTRAKLVDGTEFEGLTGLRNYLLTARRDAFVRQFCKKLLGYALGRAVQLSDEPLLEEMQSKLKADGYKIHTAVEAIVLSPQFREIRGRDRAGDD